MGLEGEDDKLIKIVVRSQTHGPKPYLNPGCRGLRDVRGQELAAPGLRRKSRVPILEFRVEGLENRPNIPRLGAAPSLPLSEEPPGPRCPEQA